jgi:hypothetical protein
MVRTTALTAALAIAPESSETFRLWRQEWERTNYTRYDLAIYLHSARYSFPAAVPLLLDEAKRTANPVNFLEAFEFFGEAARPAVPAMVQMLTNGSYRDNMMTLLKRLGPVASGAIPNLAALVDGKDPAITERALEVLKSIGPEARSALPQIEPLLTNRDFTVQMIAAFILGRIEGKPEIALPVLMQGLDRPPTIGQMHMTIDIGQLEGGIEIAGPEAAAVLLGECGPPASGALPALERKLQDKSEWVRLASAQAIWRISGSAEKALPVLFGILDSLPEPRSSVPIQPNPYLLIKAIEAIEEMGPSAKDAIPSLKRVRTFSIAARHAVNSALVRIEAPR